MRKYNISSDLIQVKSIEPVVYKQYDNGNNLEIELYEDGEKITLTDEMVLAFFELSDGTIIQKNCDINNGNAVATLDNNILSQSGSLKVEFTIYSDQNETTTRTLLITVEQSINRNESIETIPQWDIVHQVLDLKPSLEAAESERQSQESVRQENENIRLTSELARANAENERIVADGERAVSESLRETAETNRATAESARETAENTRSTNETTRQTAINNLQHKGAYNSATAYVPRNIVTYNGSSYMNIAECTNVVPTDSSKWQLVGSKGEQGIQGIKGDKGDPGNGNVDSVNGKMGPDITLNASDVGAIPASQKGVANGVAPTGPDNIIPAQHLPIPLDASTESYGQTILSNDLVDDDTKAATPKLVKEVNDTLTAHLADKANQSDLDLNVVWQGVNETVLDNSPLFGVIIESLDTGDETKTGGRIKIPRGTYKGQLIITTSSVSNLASIIVEGEGQENTTIDGSGLSSGKNGLEVHGGVFVKLKDLQVKNAPGHGIAMLSQKSGYSVWNHLQMENVRSSVNGKSGIYLERGFMASFQDVFATNNGNYGFELQGFHTSLNFTNCYGANNVWDNFFINDVVYSTFEDCGSDGAGQFGYRIRNATTVGFKNCGAESCQRSGFALEASSAIEALATINKGIQQVSFDGCFASNCDLGGGNYGNFLNAKQLDTSKIKGVKIENCYDINATSGMSIVANGTNLSIIEDNNNFVGTINYQAGAERKLLKYSHKTNGISVTASNIPICSLKNSYDRLLNYGGLVIVTARYADFTTDNANTATYLLLVGKHASGSGVTVIASNGLTTGTGASFPSFTFSLDTVNNKLLASPVGSTSGTFYFSIETQGQIVATA